MENNKIDDRSEPGEKFAWYKNHQIIAPMILVILFIGVFLAGWEFARESGHGGYRGESWHGNKSGCLERNFFQGGSHGRNGYRSNGRAGLRHDGWKNSMFGGKPGARLKSADWSENQYPGATGSFQATSTSAR